MEIDIKKELFKIFLNNSLYIDISNDTEINNKMSHLYHRNYDNICSFFDIEYGSSECDITTHQDDNNETIIKYSFNTHGYSGGTCYDTGEDDGPQEYANSISLNISSKFINAMKLLFSDFNLDFMPSYHNYSGCLYYIESILDKKYTKFYETEDYQYYGNISYYKIIELNVDKFYDFLTEKFTFDLFDNETNYTKIKNIINHCLTNINNDPTNKYSADYHNKTLHNIKIKIEHQELLNTVKNTTIKKLQKI